MHLLVSLEVSFLLFGQILAMYHWVEYPNITYPWHAYCNYADPFYWHNSSLCWNQCGHIMQWAHISEIQQSSVRGITGSIFITAGYVVCCIPEALDIYKRKASLRGFTLLSQTENPYKSPDIQTSGICLLSENFTFCSWLHI